MRRIDWPLVAVLGATAVGLAVRLAGFDQSLFGDETSTFTAVTSADSPWQVIDLVRSDRTVIELTPPLSFMLSWLAGQIGDPTEWIRLPSLIAGALLIPGVYVLGARTIGSTPAAAGAALAALSPFLIFYSQEARSYLLAALAVLLSTLALLTALDRRTLGWWAAYAVAACAAVYTSYTVVFALLAQFLWALWTYRDAWRQLVGASFVAALGFLPWLGEFFDDGRSPFNYLPVVHPLTFGNASSDLVESMIGSPTGGRGEVPGTVACVLIAGGAAVALAALALDRSARTSLRGEPDTGRRLWLLVALAAACPVGLVCWSLAGTTIMDARNLMPSVPPALLLFGALICAPRMPVRAVVVGLVLAGFAIGAIATVQPANERPPFADAARFALDRLQPGDPIYAVENADYKGLEGPLERYLRPYVPDADLRDAAASAPEPLPADVDRLALVSWKAGSLPGVTGVQPTAPPISDRFSEVASVSLEGWLDIDVRVFEAGE